MLPVLSAVTATLSILTAIVVRTPRYCDAMIRSDDRSAGEHTSGPLPKSGPEGCFDFLASATLICLGAALASIGLIILLVGVARGWILVASVGAGITVAGIITGVGGVVAARQRHSRSGNQ